MNGSLRLDGPAWAMLVGLAILWGGSFVLVEVILEEMPVITLVALRVSLAAVTLWAAVALTGGPIPRRAEVWGAFIMLGVFNNLVPFSLIVWGQTAVTASVAAILNATTPLFTALFATVALSDEKLTAQRAAGLGLGLLGVAVMIGPRAILALGSDIPHQLAVLGAAVSYGFAAVYARRFHRLGVTPMMVATGQLTASSLIIVPVALGAYGVGVLASASIGAWVAVIALACFATALAYILYFSILRRAGATNVALVTVLVPLVAVLLGVIVLGEALGMLELAGMALIFAGLATIDGRLLPFLARRVGVGRHRA
ncbi:MAG: DMT family transporter [Pseudomonadota bacterium]